MLSFAMLLLHSSMECWQGKSVSGHRGIAQLSFVFPKVMQHPRSNRMYKIQSDKTNDIFKSFFWLIFKPG